MFNQWLTLLLKELRFQIYSLTGIVFILLFLIISGCLLWVIPGAYNIMDNGYATFSSFFVIAPLLFLFLIPALSMRSFAEEKRMHTLLLLRSRPVTMNALASAKILAILITVILTLLPTLVYVLFIYFNGDPVGNLDTGAVTASYLGLIFLILAFICISVFASSITSNQIIAMITGMFLCTLFYWGWNLTGYEKIGFLYHYKSMGRGLIESSDLFYFLSVSCLFYLLILLFLGERIRTKGVVITGILFALFAFFSMSVRFSYDWTNDKRYTLHPVSKDILKELKYPLSVDLYLAGNLNSGFKRLQEATFNLLDDFGKFSSVPIEYNVVDPYKKDKDFVESLNKTGMKGIAVNERQTDGRISQHIIYPYAEIKYGETKIPVSLLTNQTGRSGEENLNLSVEMMEYNFTHAVDLLTQDAVKRIVFLEGHGELPEDAINEMIDQLSYEYTIDRGTLSGFPGELDDYDLVIIAGPRHPFTETDKFVLDQYLMQGGSLLWFIDGIQLYSYEELTGKGETMSMANDLNLNDLFFIYGLRINPVILQDVQSLNIPVVVEGESGETNYVSRPWYYSPLLLPNQKFEMTKGLSFVKTSFASTLSLVGDNTGKRSEILLFSSSLAHSIPVPAVVSMEETDREPDKKYFNESHLPVAVLIHPPFVSAFRNRSNFFTKGDYSFLEQTDSGKLIVVASEDLVVNPLGYDRYSQTQFANQEFILNAVNYLTDSKGLSVLKNKNIQLQLLDRKKLQDNKNQVIFVNVILPPLLLFVLFIILYVNRKRKYGRKVES